LIVSLNSRVALFGVPAVLPPVFGVPLGRPKPDFGLVVIIYPFFTIDRFILHNYAVFATLNHSTL
jgi:hypothetical protein